MAKADPAAHNRKAWDSLVAKGNRWTQPVSGDVIAAARKGEWGIVLTPEKPIPRSWLDPVEGKKILCLAGGGGQQAPILAAAGASRREAGRSYDRIRAWRYAGPVGFRRRFLRHDHQPVFQFVCARRESDLERVSPRSQSRRFADGRFHQSHHAHI